MRSQVLPALTSNHNPFYEFRIFDATRKESINLMTYEMFKSLLNGE